MGGWQSCFHGYTILGISKFATMASLTLRWSPGALEDPKEVSLSYKSTNRCRHSTNKGTNRLPHISKLQVSSAGLIRVTTEHIRYVQAATAFSQQSLKTLEYID